MINIRIHHFFDIIRDYGSGKIIQPHPYGHSLHLISQKITSSEIKEMRLVIECDAICENCNKLVDNHCIDTISHRKDFKLKELFNNYLDNRIMNALGLKKGQTITCAQLINLSDQYLDNIEYIYQGNDSEHTKIRAANVKKGINLMQSKKF